MTGNLKDSDSLTLAECVALVLRSQTLSKRIFSRIGVELPETERECALFESLEKNPHSFFENLYGLTKNKKASLIAAFEMGRRYHRFRTSVETSENLTHLSALKAHSLALSRINQALRSDTREWIGFVPVHSTYNIGQFCLVERGSRTFIHFEASELYARLLALRPKAYYLFHNHPSKNLCPSRQDLELTQKLKDISQAIGVPLIDHGIVSYNNCHWIML